MDAISFIVGVLCGIAVMLACMSERQEVRLLREILDEAREQTALIHHIVRQLRPRLARIQIRLGDSMADPITLNVGDSKTATVVGMDQFGQPFAIDFNAMPDSWSVDNPAVLSSTPPSPPNGTDAIVALSSGAATLSVSVGGFQDSISVTVAQAAPVLSSVKIVVS